jgi:hypothetical protein
MSQTWPLYIVTNVVYSFTVGWLLAQKLSALNSSFKKCSPDKHIFSHLKTASFAYPINCTQYMLSMHKTRPGATDDPTWLRLVWDHSPTMLLYKICMSPCRPVTLLPWVLVSSSPSGDGPSMLSGKSTVRNIHSHATCPSTLTSSS